MHAAPEISSGLYANTGNNDYKFRLPPFPWVNGRVFLGNCDKDWERSRAKADDMVSLAKAARFELS